MSRRSERLSTGRESLFGFISSSNMICGCVFGDDTKFWELFDRLPDSTVQFKAIDEQIMIAIMVPGCLFETNKPATMSSHSSCIATILSTPLHGNLDIVPKQIVKPANPIGFVLQNP